MQRYNSFSFIDADREQLDKLIGAAILDDTVRRRLIDERDKTLFDEYGLSAMTQTWLRAVRAPTLAELAGAILSFDKRFPYSRDDTFASASP